MNQELVKKLNDLKILQRSTEWEEDIPSDIYSENFQNTIQLATELDVDKHRWYELSTEVIKFKNEFIMGIRSVTNLYSEQSCVTDMFHTLKFFEMEEVQSITYKIK